jgi:hypothetical protein
MRPQSIPPEFLPTHHAFVVQCAAETPLEAARITGRVEHLASGRATRFQSVEALVAFMIAQLQDVRQRATAAEGAEHPPNNTCTTQEGAS